VQDLKKFLYVSAPAFGLKKDQWYSADDLSLAVKVPRAHIVERIRHASHINSECNLVRLEQLKPVRKNGNNKMATFSLETSADYLSQNWLRRSL